MAFHQMPDPLLDMHRMLRRVAGDEDGHFQWVDGSDYSVDRILAQVRPGFFSCVFIDFLTTEGWITKDPLDRGIYVEEWADVDCEYPVDLATLQSLGFQNFPPLPPPPAN